MLMGVGSKVMGIYDTYVNCFWPYASDQIAVVTTLITGEIKFKPDAIGSGDKKCPDNRCT